MKSVDILGRDSFVDKIVQFIECLSKNHGNSTFAIEGDWGTGKTYVLEMLKEKLNPIKSEETSDDKYLIFHYNCWEYDYYEEPLAAIMVPVVDMIRKEKSIFGKNVDGALREMVDEVKGELKNALGKIAKEKMGVDIIKFVEKLINGVKEEESQVWDFDQHVKFRENMEKVKKSLGKLAKERTIVFIVDELDRCLPTYAIQVLERLHHLFENMENVAVILAIDNRQLIHSVQQIFGTDDELVENYLRKFIDFSFSLDVGNVSVSFEEKYKEYFSRFIVIDENDMEKFQEMYKNIYSGLDIRTQEKLIGKATSLHNIICGEKMADPSLMLFEILWTGLAYMAGNTDLKWLVGVGNTIGMEERNKISCKKMQYLKRVENELGQREGAVRNFSGTLLEKVFWLLASLYYDVSDNMCDEYKYDENDSLTYEMECAKQYDEIAKNIRWCRKININEG